MNIRFRDKFHLYLNMPMELGDFALPKMVLQPLVENAVMHGLCQEEGTIDISIFRQEELLYIIIQDNGRGINPDVLADLKETLADSGKLYERSIRQKKIGIANVCLRIRNCFGSGYGISLENIPDSGAKVTVAMPYSDR